MIKVSGKFATLILAANCLLGPVEARDADPLFASNETLQVTLEAPFAELMKERDEELELAGSIRYTDSDGTPIEFDVRVRTRGKFRARADVCNFAPIRLNFKKSQTKGTLFANQDKLKLVTHCKTRSATYEQAVIREYLTYRTLNLLTNISYRVRLLRIRYQFTDRDRSIENYAFLIESDDRLAKRIGQDVVATEKLSLRSLQAP